MSEVRKHERYYIKDKDQFSVQVEANAGKIVDCYLSDISVSGACIIVNKEVFLQREKQYPFQILEKQADGEFKIIATPKGKIVWYLSKEFQVKDMMFLGIEFEEKIQIPTSLILQVEVA